MHTKIVLLRREVDLEKGWSMDSITSVVYMTFLLLLQLFSNKSHSCILTRVALPHDGATLTFSISMHGG